MVKFSSAEDTGLRRLLGELIRWEGLVRPAPSSQLVIRETTPCRVVAADSTGPGLPCHYIPLPKNKRFVGRDGILDALKRMCFSQECQRVVVMGLGGIGRTQVVLKFAYWVRENKPEYSVLWAPALSRATFEQAYAEIARKLPVQKGS